jgi:hypothetical protein
MALVIITIQDTADNSVDIRLNSEPVVDQDTRMFTIAQRLGSIALNAITEKLNEPKQQIIIAGADELPH